jgi:hypothetical protein
LEDGGRESPVKHGTKRANMGGNTGDGGQHKWGGEDERKKIGRGRIERGRPARAREGARARKDQAKWRHERGGGHGWGKTKQREAQRVHYAPGSH